MGMKALIKHKSKIVLYAVLLLQLLCMFHFGDAKQGYFVDELWSYGLANSYYRPHVYSDEALEGTWVSGDYFRDYLEVLPNQRFKYGSVIFNQKNDAHPPLFYMVLHTISSLFPNTFSKWYGILPNIFYFLISMLLLFRFSKRLLKNEWLALSVIVAYGFSAGAISNVIYIRMYMLLTLWIVALLDLHTKWILGEAQKPKELFWLVAITYLGCMSHYYFFIVAFFVGFYYFFYLLLQKRTSDAVRYCAAMFFSLLLIAVTFPTAYKKLFFDERGGEAVHNLFSLHDFVHNAVRYFEILGEQLFACKLQYFLLALLVLGGFALLHWVWNHCKDGSTPSEDIRIFRTLNERQNRVLAAVLFLAWVLCCYLAVIAKIAPYQVDRYIFGIYPPFLLLVFFLLYRSIRYWCAPAVSLVLMLLISIGLAAFGVNGKHVQYIYADHKDNVRIMEEHAGEVCLYITWDYYKLVGNALELEYMGSVHADVPDRIEELPSMVDPAIDKMIVYVDEDFDQEEILGRVCESLGFSTWEPLFESRCFAYEVRKN